MADAAIDIVIAAAPMIASSGIPFAAPAAAAAGVAARALRRSRESASPPVGQWRPRPTERGHRAGRMYQERAQRHRAVQEPVRQAGPPVEIWEDAGERLLAHLRMLTFGVERTYRTPASLMQKATSWLVKNKQHLGEQSHEVAMHDIATWAVTQALVPDAKETRLMDVYGNRTKMWWITAANVTATSMSDGRATFGFGWLCLLLAGILSTMPALTGYGGTPAVCLMAVGIVSSLVLAIRIAWAMVRWGVVGAFAWPSGRQYTY